MSNTNQRYLDGTEFNNLSIISTCNEDGSIEAQGSLFIDTIVSYTLNSGISLQQSIFNSDGSVIITSTQPVYNCGTTIASLIVNGGLLIKKDSVISGILRLCNTSNSIGLSTGSLIINGGVAINQNLNINGITTLYNSTSSINSSIGALISFGGISIQNTTDAISYTSGGSLTILGGASIAQTLYANLLNSTNSTISNIYNTNFYNTNSSIGILNVNSANLSNSTIQNLIVNSFSSGQSILTNATINNIFVETGTISNLYSINNYLINSTISNLDVSNGNINNLNSTSGIISILTVGNLYVTNAIEYNDLITNLSTSNVLSLFSSIGSLQLTIGTFGSLYGDIFIVNNSTISNLKNNNFINTTSTIQNLFNTNSTIQNLNSLNSIISNSTISNLTTNYFINNYETVSNSYIINSTISNLNSVNIQNVNLLSDYSTIGNLLINGTIPSYNSTIATLVLEGGLSINNTTNAYSNTDGGGITDAGGLSVALDVYIGGTLNSTSISSDFIISSNLTTGLLYISTTEASNNATDGALISAGGISIFNTTDVTSLSSGGGLTDAGGASIAKSLLVGGTIGASVISASNGIFSSLTVGSLTATSLTNVNLTTQNLTVSSETVTNLFIINSSTSNANFSNISTGTIISSSGNISNLILDTATFGNIIVNYLTSNYITNNILLTSQNASISNLNSNNSSISNLNILYSTFGNLYGSYIESFNGTINTLLSTNSTLGNTYINNSTIVNILANNITSSNIYSDNSNILNASIGILFATNISVGTINNVLLNSTNVISTNTSISNLTVINSTFNNISVLSETLGNLILTGNATISNLNSINNTFDNVLINSSIPSYNSTTGSLILENGGISINCTVNAYSFTNGGSATLAGGLAVLQDAYLGGNVWINEILNVGGNVIQNCTAPTLGLDVVNLWYLQNKFTIGNVFGNFTQGQVIIAGSGGNILSYPTFTYDSSINLLTLYGTVDATSLTNGGTLQVYGGVSIDLSLYVGSNAHILGYLDMNNNKIMSVDTCTMPYDVANKYYVDEKFINYTAGQVIIGDINETVLGYQSFTYDGTLLSIFSTITALGLGSGGSLNINGGVSILENVYIGGGLDVNGTKITNCTAPSSNLDVVNLWYLDNTLNNLTIGNVFGNFTQGQIIIAGTGGNILGYPSFTYDGTQVSILNTNENALSILGGVYISNGLNVNDSSIINVPLPINRMDAVNKEYVDYFLGINNGTIREMAVTLGNNILMPTNIPNFIFSNLSVSSFVSYAYLQIPELNIYDQFEIRGLFKNTTWELNTSFIGDNFNGVQFNIINDGNNGQIQYINKNITGTAILRFRADTTSQGEFSNITIGNSIISTVIGGGTGQTFFTNGCILLGNGSGPIATDITLQFTNEILTLSNSTPSLNLTSPGAMLIQGGLCIEQNLYIGNGLDVGGTKITNCTAPSSNLDVVNLWYLQNKYTTGNVNGDFTKGQLLIGDTGGNIVGYPTLTYDGSLLSIFNTIPALGLNSGGCLNIDGGVSILENVYIGGGLDVNGTKITNCTAPSSNLDVVNLWYLDNTLNNLTIGNVFGNFTQGQIIIAGTGGNILGYPSFTYDGTQLYISSTSNALGLGSGGSLNINGGTSILKDVYIGGTLVLNDTRITNVADPINQFDVVNLEYLNHFLGFNNGDIPNTCVTLGNNINSPQNIPYFTFNTQTSSFVAYAYLQIPTLQIYDQYELRGLINNGNWQLDSNFIGKFQPQVNFTINSSGNILYTNNNTSGLATLCFRATTISTVNNSLVNIINNTNGNLNGIYPLGSILIGNDSNIVLTTPNLEFLNNQLYVNTVSLTPSSSDIFTEQTFYANNNQSSVDNIIGFIFNTLTTRYFQAIVSCSITTSTSSNNLYAGYELKGINLNGLWELNSSFIGQNTGVKFFINYTTGQLQYTSNNISGFISNIIKFRALTTTI